MMLPLSLTSGKVKMTGSRASTCVFCIARLGGSIREPARQMSSGVVVFVRSDGQADPSAPYLSLKITEKEPSDFLR